MELELEGAVTGTGGSRMQSPVLEHTQDTVLSTATLPGSEMGFFSCAEGWDSVSLHLKHPRSRSAEQPLNQQEAARVTSLFLEPALPLQPTHGAAPGAGEDSLCLQPVCIIPS